MVLFNRLHIWIRSKEAHNDRMDMWPKGFWKGKEFKPDEFEKFIKLNKNV